MLINENEIKNLGLLPILTKPVDHLCFLRERNILVAGSSQDIIIKLLSFDSTDNKLTFSKEFNSGLIGLYLKFLLKYRWPLLIQFKALFYLLAR